MKRLIRYFVDNVLYSFVSLFVVCDLRDEITKFNPGKLKIRLYNFCTNFNVFVHALYDFSSNFLGVSPKNAKRLFCVFVPNLPIEGEQG